MLRRRNILFGIGVVVVLLLAVGYAFNFEYCEPFQGDVVCKGGGCMPPKESCINLFGETHFRN